MSNNNVNNSIEESQNFADQILHKFISSSWKAFYLPKIYEGIVDFFLELTHKNYPNYRSDVDRAIREVGKIHAKIEESRITPNQINELILDAVNNILIATKAPRTVENRIKGVQCIFPDQLNGFKIWFNNYYTEENNGIPLDIDKIISQDIAKITKEIQFLLKDPKKNEKILQKIKKDWENMLKIFPFFPVF